MGRRGAGAQIVTYDAFERWFRRLGVEEQYAYVTRILSAFAPGLRLRVAFGFDLVDALASVARARGAVEQELFRLARGDGGARARGRRGESPYRVRRLQFAQHVLRLLEDSLEREVLDAMGWRRQRGGQPRQGVVRLRFGFLTPLDPVAVATQARIGPVRLPLRTRREDGALQLWVEIDANLETGWADYRVTADVNMGADVRLAGLVTGHVHYRDSRVSVKGKATLLTS